MNIWNKIDNFFAYKPQQREGAAAAAAAAAAADIPLYAKNLITRPERAKNLIDRVDKFEKLPVYDQAKELIPLYLDLESYIIENEPVKKYTKESLRLEIYTALNLKESLVPFVGFFTPDIEGAFSLMKELFSKWADPAFEALGKKKVGEIIRSIIEGTVFEGIEYDDGILDFAHIQSRLINNTPPEEEFKRVFGRASDAVALPVMELRGHTPSVYLLRKKVLKEWVFLHSSKTPAWQEQKAVIPITPQAREMMKDVGMEGLITRGVISGIETNIVSKNGEAKPVNVTASALKDEVGSIQGMVIAAKDLTEIRQLEQERIEALETANMQAEGLVKERTANLVKAQEELENKVFELEKFNNVAVGRELKMIELKKEISDLKSKLKE